MFKIILYHPPMYMYLHADPINKIQIQYILDTYIYRTLEYNYLYCAKHQFNLNNVVNNLTEPRISIGSLYNLLVFMLLTNTRR